ncbi:MAG: N-acetylgalactosamine-4-sulfatase [Opitutales bacterium]|nr:MAG: N-acetylgalactosamine-4-sulfatase [Opitutales bacterium]
MKSLIFFALLFLPLVGLQAADTKKPNILFIVADDLGYGELGCYGGNGIPTPNIDRLIAKGARFTDGYVTAPFCAASRAALLTGRYQTSFGFEFNPIGSKNLQPGIGLPVGIPTVADRLRTAGYHTGLVGKWHLGGTAPFHPQQRGFDEFFGFLHEGHYFEPQPGKGNTTWLRRKNLPDGAMGRWTSPDGRLILSDHLKSDEPEYNKDNPILRGNVVVNEPSNLTDAFTREAMDFFDRSKEKPFFLYLAYNAVHSPMQGTDAHMKRFKEIPDVHRRVFAAMLTHLDESVGKLMAKLDANGQTENTLIVFLSDNGGPTRELTSSNHPLRGEKGQLLEGGIRIPFAITWPGVTKPGTIIKTPAIATDLAVTALAAAGLDRHTDADGKDLRSLLASPSAGPLHETLFWRVGKNAALRTGKWKLFRAGARWELYDLEADPSESQDVAAGNKELTKTLVERWEAWSKTQAEPLWR